MFVHLRIHTEFSVVDGTNRIDEIVAAAAADRQPALAITDLGNLFGTVKFYREARGAGVKPLIGADVWVETPGKEPGAPAARLLLLVQNHRGYLNLSELLTRAWTKNVLRDQAIVKLEWLEELNEGLIALSGAQGGAVGQALVQGDGTRAMECALRLGGIFPHRFYLELQRAQRPDDERHVSAAVQLAARLKLPVVATHPVQFLTYDDYEAHEARVCIAEGEILGNARRVRKFTREQYFKSAALMSELFADVPSALANTLEIAKRCSLTLELGKPMLPDYPTPPVDGVRLPIDAYFRHASFEGLEARLKHLYPQEVREQKRPVYVERLEFEIKTILKMGFPGYFLIVGDFINWAKNNGCPVGPGRGSGAGSLVAYSLNITDLDPLQYNLLFERFLNPERVSMPDFDIDFCQANRDRVIDYVKDKYGHEAVSQIVTFGTMAARAAIRDVGRVLDFPYGFCDGISKLIPNKPGQAVTLQLLPAERKKSDKMVYALEAEPVLAERERKEEDVHTLLELARKLEGLTRNVGMHAGGVLIAPGKLTDFCPLYLQPGSSSAVSQFDKNDVEAIGLVKFDFLGLATLTILEIARQFIMARHPAQKDFKFEDLPLNDARVYRLFAEGKTEAVFQFESIGMQRMLKDARPDRLEDLIAMNALYRPGPMDLIPTYIARKQGKEVPDYPDPRVKPMLEETYGIMVYQEQVMQTAQILGGYSLGGADMLRRAMGKKDEKEMAAHREIFRKGAGINGLSEEKADEVFDLMEKFAGYGFNKSHSAAYALLAYHTAWLKVHYTAEFFAANMTVEMGDTDKLKILHSDALKMDISFESPDVNRGDYRFEPTSNKSVRYGLGAIKGTGQQAIEAIVAARQSGGPFTSLFDFCVRVDRSKLNKRTVEALIKAGAFDNMHLNRAELLASVDRAFEFAAATEANANQGGLFDMSDSHAASTQEPELVATVPFGVKARLVQEKTAIGFYLSGHLFDEVETEVRKFARLPLADLIDSRETQLLAAIVTDLRVINGNRGKVIIFKLDDKTKMLEASVDENLYNAHRHLLKDDELVIVQGTLQRASERFGERFKVTQVWDLESARCKFGKYLRVAVNGTAPDIARLVRDFPPRREMSEQGELRRGLPVRLSLRRDGVAAEIHLGEAAQFFPTDAALASWTAQADKGLAQVIYE
ncbi:DNA polymerase III subunit alpha [Polaromonas sp.]|jgi:DNA polymerase-3 subunit alpha|uniref:DNA polymerase III subunit alpha n=1 Tax=Polaromonas sp. TaxID=1869339 RepID=UPI002C7B6E3A|nr:DNA polymerase III subunit alpha [Polaromonas sp.]HQS30686.1 DNA polymerase III subunit alpha [Polaromonas sp.]HQS90472.1 DNA polymerase III subunit alpha [Polaromonas sp.]